MQTWCHAWVATSAGTTAAGLDNGKRRLLPFCRSGWRIFEVIVGLGRGDNARLASDYGIREHVWISVAPSHSRLLQLLVSRTGVLHPFVVNNCPEIHWHWERETSIMTRLRFDIVRGDDVLTRGIATPSPCRPPAPAPHFPVRTGHPESCRPGGSKFRVRPC